MLNEYRVMKETKKAYRNFKKWLDFEYASGKLHGKYMSLICYPFVEENVKL